MLEEKLREILERVPGIREDLEAVRSLNLPEGCIAAGYVRNRVWDDLHGYAYSTSLNDVDVLYYDPDDLDGLKERQLENQLRQRNDVHRWSVKNQARMHLRNGDAPYRSVGDAMLRWPETVTAIAIALEPDNRIRIVSPYGLDDLFGLVLRHSPYFKDKEAYLSRIKDKGWLNRWPRLRMVDAD